jgi:hypothetical protein
LNTASNQ